MGIISQDDWSLDRRGQQAQERHKAKVKQAIKANLADVVANEGLILSDGKNTVRIPVHSLDEPHFYFDKGQQQHVGQGPGESGDVIGSAVPGKAPGTGSGAGESPGEAVYEAEIVVDDVEEVLFADLRLPNLRPKEAQKEVVEQSEWSDVRNKGLHANVDRKRTFFEALKRSQMNGQDFHILKEDMRFRTWEDIPRPHHGAVIVAMMDISGSMGEFEKYVARTFFFWMERFLSKHYPRVEMRYLVHHTEALEVSKSEFYAIRESGGTRCSSVYQLGLDVIGRDYPVESWNIYPIHVSDGDNLSSDNHSAVSLFKQLCEVSALGAYLEVHAYQKQSTLAERLQELAAMNFRSFTVPSKEFIHKALQHFFREEAVG